MDLKSRDNRNKNNAVLKIVQTAETLKSNIDKNSMGTNPVTDVPPEVWEMIADNVISGKDLASLSIAVPKCGKLLHPKRVEWLFEQVLPIVLTHNKDLAKDDILNCRRVCRHWSYAVDVFVENILHSAPGENTNLNMNGCQLRPELLSYKLALKSIAKMSRTNMLVMLNEAQGHPRNPIIGKIVKLGFPTSNRQGDVTLVYDFLEMFGPHISFLHISFHGRTDPTTFMNVFVPLMRRVPNLKKMVVEKFLRSNSEKPFTPTRINAVKRQLDKTHETHASSASFRNGIPKVEDLNLIVNGLCEHTLKNMFISLFFGISLKSLTLSDIVFAQGSNLSLPNLKLLNLTLKTNEQLKSVIFLNCPKVEKLVLDLENFENVNCEVLFMVLDKFKNMLNHLELTLPNFLDTTTLIANGLGLIGDSSLMLFFDNDVLKMRKLKVLTLLGFRPPSFNFMAGFGSLENLNLYFERQVVWEHFLMGLYHPDVQNYEILDIVQKLKPMWSTLKCVNKPVMRSSNLWNIFPILKSLKINKELRWESLGKISEWQYRQNN